MTSHRCRPIGTAALAALWACTLSAEAGPLDIAPARHFQFTPQPGTAWYLDGTSDGQSWAPQAGPFFATGAAVDHFQQLGPVHQFRLRYVDPATLGSAPVSVGGTSVILQTAGEPIEVVFFQSTLEPRYGTIRMDATHERTFTYTWKKTSADEGEAFLDAAGGRITLLRLKFSDRSLGRWGMEDLPHRAAAALIKQPLDSGAFSFRTGRFRRGQTNANLPGDLNGRSLILNEGGRLTFLKFTGATTAKVTTPKGQVLDSTYAYDPESSSLASLNLNLPNITPLDLRLELKSPGTGTFQDNSGSAGQPASRNGTLTIPDEHAPPVNPNCPPQSVAGLSFFVRDKISSLCTITFKDDGSGEISKIVNDALQITPFRYSYSCTGGRSAKISLLFPGGAGDATDEYDMTWKDDCTGTFTRDSFADGNAAGSRNGTFGPSGGAGAPPP